MAFNFALKNIRWFFVTENSNVGRDVIYYPTHPQTIFVNSPINRKVMTTNTIRKIPVDYLQVADEKKVRAIYTMVEDDINTVANDWDEDFIQEMERRSKSFVDGTAKTYTWEETKRAGKARFE